MYKKIWWCQNINDTYKRFIIYFRRMSMCIWTFLFYHLFESLDSRIFIVGLPVLHDKIRTILSVANWTRHDFMDNMEKEGITMLYVYDILLNFTDVHTYLNFFEWENKKELTHVKKIPLLKIPNYQLKEIYENRIQLQDAIWAKLQGKAKASGKKNLTTFLLTDGMKVFAVAFNSKSVLEMRSELLADDEDDIVQLGDDLPFTKLEYRILNKTYQKRFCTRKEMTIKAYLKSEFLKAYQKEDKNKLMYLYKDYFNQNETDIKTMYESLTSSLEQIDSKHKKLYDLLQLVKK